jgi:hypothetical protein
MKASRQRARVTAALATLNSLMKQLDVEVRLDATIDRLMKRLLFVRASNPCQPPLQSLSSAFANHAKAA